MGSLSIVHWVIIIAVALLLFGGRGKISSLMGDFAEGIKAFKKGMQDEDKPVTAESRPNELPAVLRTVGQWMAKIRRMAAEFQGQFNEAMREAEMADIKKHVDDLTDVTRNIGSGFDPLGTTKQEIESAMADKPPIAPAP